MEEGSYQRAVNCVFWEDLTTVISCVKKFVAESLVQTNILFVVDMHVELGVFIGGVVFQQSKARHITRGQLFK